MDHQAAITKLKATVLHTEDFNVAWDEFFDLTLMPKFIDKSIPAHLENLEPVLHQIGQIMIPHEISTLKASILLQYADSGLYHGSLVSASKRGTVMYFKDLDMGMVALTNKSGGNTDFFRFTMTLVGSPHCYIVPTSGVDQPSRH